MIFYRKITNFLDLQEYHIRENKRIDQISLSQLAQEILRKPLCKGEQLSNWESRPLRNSQTHYAALDAWVLTEIAT